MTKKRARRSIRKRSFLLFELLISLALIVLCLFPLIKPHAAMRKIDREHLEAVQLEQVAQIAFCQLKEKLYQNSDHSWNDLMNYVTGTLNDEDFSIFIEKKRKKYFTCTYSITAIDEVNKPSQHKTGLAVSVTLNLTCGLQTHTFNRFLYLEGLST